jgi:BirA family biotin operon repressor/biotin-[acetyl-CoA-carboxylase] ligase
MPIGKKVYRAQSTDDSMGWARSLLHDAPDGAVFLADVLTQAKGRQGRFWQIMPGQLIVTFLLKPPMLKLLPAEDLHIRLNQLNMAISLGVLEPLKPYGVGLKWPNDFILDQKKIGGLLMNLVWEGQQPQGIIVGFALNVNNEITQNDQLYAFATSIKAVCGADVDRRSLYKSMLVSLNAWYDAWQQARYMPIYKHWKDEQICLGLPIKIHQKDGTIVEGTAQQVLPNGDLLLVDQYKKQKTVSFYQVEEVSIAP